MGLARTVTLGQCLASTCHAPCLKDHGTLSPVDAPGLDGGQDPVMDAGVGEIDGGPHDEEDLDIFQVRAQVAY